VELPITDDVIDTVHKIARVEAHRDQDDPIPDQFIFQQTSGTILPDQQFIPPTAEPLLDEGAVLVDQGAQDEYSNVDSKKESSESDNISQSSNSSSDDENGDSNDISFDSHDYNSNIK
jgi:hypothetical protein